MSPQNRESVADARSTGITVQTPYTWRSHWQKQGQLLPVTTKPPEQWSALDRLAAVIQAAGLIGPDLGASAVSVAFTPGSLPTGGRPPRMPMAPALRAWLISETFNARIRS